MKIHVLEREQRVAHPLAQVFKFFARAENLARINRRDLERILEFRRQAISQLLG